MDHQSAQLRDALLARFASRPESADAGDWAHLHGAGVTAMLVPEDCGGLGLALGDVAPVMDVIGRAGLAAPYLESVVLCGGILRRLRSGDGDKLLRRSADDGTTLALASPVEDSNEAPATARRGAQDWRIDGRKTVVIGAAEAAAMLVVAQEPAGTLSIFAIEAGSAGVTMHVFPTIDARSAADIEFRDVPAVRLGPAYPAIAEATGDAIAALAVEAAAIMAALVEETAAYCKLREQFGQPISHFQVVQHRLVDMHIQARRAKAAAAMAMAAADADPAMRARATSAAKVTIARCGRFVGQSAVQLHGGMGMTDELGIGRRFKRLTAIEAEFGGVDQHLRRYMETRAAA